VCVGVGGKSLVCWAALAPRLCDVLLLVLDTQELSVPHQLTAGESDEQARTMTSFESNNTIHHSQQAVVVIALRQSRLVSLRLIEP
jgi:hypothetical protein